MGSCRQAGDSITILESTQNIVVLCLQIGAFFPNQSTEGIMRLLTLFFLLYLTQASRIRRQSLIDRIRAQARGQAKPVECRACRERARETPNMACCRCQDEDAFCNNNVAKPPARLPIEDFPGDLLSVRAGLITGRDPLGDGGRPQSRPRREPICERQDLAAVVNFNFGVNSWDLHSSEICAGGEPGVDSCDGEGGAPLVCLDENTDQFYAVGLVGYGFGCEDAIPAVYTNLANSEVKRFIESAFSRNFC